MAHLEKFTKGAVNGIIMHVERKVANHSNKEIDITKTYLNYSLLEDKSNANDRLRKRLDEVYMLNRKNVNAVCSWVVSLPAELIKRTDKDKKIFFKEVNDFLSERYGGEKNVIFSEVHNDETTPHLHFAFIPVVYDEIKDREKVSAKDVIDRKELKVFHNELDLHLKSKIPAIYQSGILNDKTIPLDSIKEIKLNKVIIGEIEEKAKFLNQSLAPLRNEYFIKRSYMSKINDISEQELYSHKVKHSRTLFGTDKVTLSKADYDNLFMPFHEKKEFEKLKIQFDERMDKYSSTDFWEEYKILKKDNHTLLKKVEELEKDIVYVSEKVWAFEWLEKFYNAFKPMVKEYFDIIKKITEKLPIGRDFALGFISSIENDNNLLEAFDMAVRSNEYGFESVKDEFDLVSRSEERQFDNIDSIQKEQTVHF